MQDIMPANVSEVTGAAGEVIGEAWYSVISDLW